MNLPRTRAFTRTELLVVVAVLALLVAMFLPALKRAKERAQLTTCAGRLKEIGIAFKTWAVERTNDFPMRVSDSKGGTRESVETGLAFPHFQVLTNELSTPRVLICPADEQRTAAKDFASLSNRKISYFMALDALEEIPQMFLAGDRNVTNGTPLPPDWYSGPHDQHYARLDARDSQLPRQCPPGRQQRPTGQFLSSARSRRSE